MVPVEYVGFNYAKIEFKSFQYKGGKLLNTVVSTYDLKSNKGA